MLNPTLAEVDASQAFEALSLTAFRIQSLNDPALTNLPPTSAFQTRAYVNAVLETIMPAERAEPVLVGVKSAAGRLVALVPFALRRRLGMRVLEGLDFQVVDYFAPSMAQDIDVDADQLWALVLKALPPADAVLIKKVPQNFRGRRHALSGNSKLKPMGAAAHFTDLGTSFNPNDLSVAKDARRKSRKLAAQGELAFKAMSEAADIRRALDTMFKYRLRRFAEIGRPDPLASSHFRRFYEVLATCPGSPAMLFALTVGKETVAVVYTLRHNDTLTLLIPAFSTDPTWTPGSPGIVALYEAIKWATEHGLTMFDLSVGSSDYKARFNSQPVNLLEYHHALTPRALPAVFEAELRRQLRIKCQTDPQLRAMLERVRTRFVRARRTER